MDDRVPAVDAPHRGADANNEQTPLLVQKAEQAHKGAGDSSKPVEQKKGDALRKPNQHFPLLTYDESLKEVPWQTDNAYIQTGYRRHMSTVGLCLWSSIACTSSSVQIIAPSGPVPADSQTFTTKPVFPSLLASFRTVLNSRFACSVDGPAA